VPININWSNIRALEGECTKGFEELCAQLARKHIPEVAKFIRKGKQDAGVECFCIFEDESEWGWQAKYLQDLDSNKWPQITKSVKTALVKHPKLTKYFVCVPVDRADARTGDQSALNKWESAVEEWSLYATSLGMDVEFIYWGSSELIDKISKPENIGLQSFWFELPTFSPQWFEDRLKESIRTAGPRYIPEISLKLPIHEKIELFSRPTNLQRFAKELSEELTIQSKKVFSLAHEISSGFEIDTFNLDLELFQLLDSEIEDFSNYRAELIGDPTKTDVFSDLYSASKKIFATVDKISRSVAIASSAFSGVDEERKLPNLLGKLFDLMETASRLLQFIEESIKLSSSEVFILSGKAGAGKTHFLCDIANLRQNAGLPTLLLMGQRFTSLNDPWEQMMQQLGLARLSVDEFVGALESAAQSCGTRLLILFDGLNEGQGTKIWPANLNTLLTRLSKSCWLGVVLSIRSPFENLIFPDELPFEKVEVEHNGFSSLQSKDLKPILDYYGLHDEHNLLSSPEFQNPLFLITVCKTAFANRESTIPIQYRSFSFVLYEFLKAINTKLSMQLSLDPKKNVVSLCVSDLSGAFVSVYPARWLRRDQAEQLIEKYHPSQPFDKSLFFALISEGILTEDCVPESEGKFAEVISFSFERFGDFLIAEKILNMRSEVEKSSQDFTGLQKSGYLDSPGLLEAFSVLIAEKYKIELANQVSSEFDKKKLSQAFWNGVIWRNIDSFSQSTFTFIETCVFDENSSFNAFENLLNISTTVNHPLNAKYLHTLLKKMTLSNRDRFWSIFLYNNNKRGGLVLKLLNRVFSREVFKEVKEVQYLNGILFIWMFTSSDRFLRDKATIALMLLCSPRISVFEEYLQHFANVNDVYVLERLYAACYGATLRSHNKEDIKRLGQFVFDQFFKDKQPIAHILLRDYARGIIEKTIQSGATLEGDIELIRPPYKSEWPIIPSEDQIALLKPDYSRSDFSEEEAGRGRIISSIIDGDFGVYVIGSKTSWLSKRLTEPRWEEPPSTSSLEKVLVEKFTEEEKQAWEIYKDERCSEFYQSLLLEEERTTLNEVDPEKELATKLNARNKLKSCVSTGILQEIESYFYAEDNFFSRSQAPSFDWSIARRYIIKRVFDLGWTNNLFGIFDYGDIGYAGRKANKVERIGKKYQWIAYHEIMALISDHFQYYDGRLSSPCENQYVGPWQNYFRDIDPSNSIGRKIGGTGWDGHMESWWCEDSIDWKVNYSDAKWVREFNDIPNIEKLLFVENPDENSSWINTDSFYIWMEQKEKNQSKKELWIEFTGYLVNNSELDAFKSWAKNINFWGRWMPETPERYECFLGEHAWSPAAKHFKTEYYSGNDWNTPANDCPAKLHTIAHKYLRESTGFDCFVQDSLSLRLPSNWVVNKLKITWLGEDARFIDESGSVIAYDPTAEKIGPDSLLFLRSNFENFLTENNFSICWMLLGEKRILESGFGERKVSPSLQLSGLFIYHNRKFEGHLNGEYFTGNPEVKSEIFKIIE